MATLVKIDELNLELVFGEADASSDVSEAIVAAVKEGRVIALGNAGSLIVNFGRVGRVEITQGQSVRSELRGFVSAFTSLTAFAR
jgi:hypothetical protein